jgi:hypothetical protein
VTLPPDAATGLPGLDTVSGWDPDAFRFVRLALVREGRTVSSDVYWLAPGDDFTALNALADVELEATARIEADATAGSGSGAGRVASGQRRVVLTVTNPGDRLAFFVRPSLRGPDGEEVLPVYWSDAYFSLLPGETRTLTATVDAFRLEGGAPVVRVEGWNVPVREVRVGR